MYPPTKRQGVQEGGHLWCGMMPMSQPPLGVRNRRPTKSANTANTAKADDWLLRRGRGTLRGTITSACPVGERGRRILRHKRTIPKKLKCGVSRFPGYEYCLVIPVALYRSMRPNYRALSAHFGSHPRAHMYSIGPKHCDLELRTRLPDALSRGMPPLHNFPSWATPGDVVENRAMRA